MRVGVCKEIWSPWGREVGWSQSLSPKYLSRNLGGYIPGQSKGAIQTCCLLGSGSLLIQHFHSPYYSFSSPLCHRDKKQPLWSKITPVSGGRWFTVHRHFPANAKDAEEDAGPPAWKGCLQLSHGGQELTFSPSAPPMPSLQATLTNSSVPAWEKWSRVCSGSTFYRFQIQTWMLNLVCVRLSMLSLVNSPIPRMERCSCCKRIQAICRKWYWAREGTRSGNPTVLVAPGELPRPAWCPHNPSFL